MQNSRRDKMQNSFFTIYYQSMARIMAALKSYYAGNMFSQQINNFALTTMGLIPMTWTTIIMKMLMIMEIQALMEVTFIWIFKTHTHLEVCDRP